MTQSKHPRNRRKSGPKADSAAADRNQPHRQGESGDQKRQKTGGGSVPPRGKSTRGGSARSTPGASSGLWLYGIHAVLAAMANPKRRKEQLFVSREAAKRHGDDLERLLALPGAPHVLQTGRDDFLSVLSESAVHQGLALQCGFLTQPHLEDLIAAPEDKTGAAGQSKASTDRRGGTRPVVLVLDQVTDPQNVGAILRSAAAFGARAVVTTGRNAAQESGVLVKTASGAFDHIPYIAVINLARALESLKSAGYWSLGLTGEGERTLAEAKTDGPAALVLGAEGSGLRRLTRETCDELVRLPTHEPISSLNVSNAAAVALYELLS
jgi:23S rRNA (guanosine2251-2'-O)-methyltransferase